MGVNVKCIIIFNVEQQLLQYEEIVAQRCSVSISQNRKKGQCDWILKVHRCVIQNMVNIYKKKVVSSIFCWIFFSARSLWTRDYWKFVYLITHTQKKSEMIFSILAKQGNEHVEEASMRQIVFYHLLSLYRILLAQNDVGSEYIAHMDQNTLMEVILAICKLMPLFWNSNHPSQLKHLCKRLTLHFSSKWFYLLHRTWCAYIKKAARSTMDDGYAAVENHMPFWADRHIKKQTRRKRGEHKVKYRKKANLQNEWIL